MGSHGRGFGGGTLPYFFLRPFPADRSRLSRHLCPIRPDQKKQHPYPVVEGLFCEMAWLSIPDGLTLAYLISQGSSEFTTHGSQTSLFLIGTGAVTSIPLLVFTFGAKRISLTLVGLTQYMAPTLQLLIGLYIFHESFPPEKQVGFSIIWIALILYSTEGIGTHLRRNSSRSDKK